MGQRTTVLDTRAVSANPGQVWVVGCALFHCIIVAFPIQVKHHGLWAIPKTRQLETSWATRWLAQMTSEKGFSCTGLAPAVFPSGGPSQSDPGSTHVQVRIVRRTSQREVVVFIFHTLVQTGVGGRTSQRECWQYVLCLLLVRPVKINQLVHADSLRGHSAKTLITKTC